MPSLPSSTTNDMDIESSELLWNKWAMGYTYLMFPFGQKASEKKRSIRFQSNPTKFPHVQGLSYVNISMSEKCSTPIIL